MTAIRFETIDADGAVVVDNGMLSARAHTSALDDARAIADGTPTGWVVRLWKDVDLLHPLAAQGQPHAVVVANDDGDPTEVPRDQSDMDDASAGTGDRADTTDDDGV
jgi:hypothetical protein